MTKDEDVISRTDLIRKLKAWDSKANGIPNYAWSVINELPSITPKEWSGIMNYEYEIKQIKSQLQNLQEIVLRMSRSNTEEVSAREQTTAQVDSLTPYTETKTAYIGDTEISFDNVPSGNISVFGLNGYYIETYELGVLTISFPALDQVTDITISVV